MVEGKLAVAEYQHAGRRLCFTHTFVPPEARGRGIAEALVRFALEDARAHGLRVVPACSYVARFIQQNREFADLVDPTLPS